ncbi:UNVERIFIED_CONTAM: hypothetical protein Slati_2763800 [Sesamum latifolium]|uniref:Uncharacterized protein n=1 Tax=Sesamum latifolium TaxID=2727402 RepID=A0AAW2W2E4_9LAMI
MTDFMKSLEFQLLLSDNALKYYSHGYLTCVTLFMDASCPPLTALTGFLDIHVGLAYAPEPDKEVPYELPETLLYTTREGEAPKDPWDQMVEDDFPLKVVPLAGGDEGVPPP